MLWLAVMATSLVMSVANAQVRPNMDVLKPYTDQNPERMRRDEIQFLKEEKERITAYEKERLKTELERLDALVTRDSLTPDQAQQRKEAAARLAAQNIDNKTAIVDNQIALIERGEPYQPRYNHGYTLEIGFGNAYDDNGSTLLGLHYRAAGLKTKYDKRTTTDVVIAGGLSNVTLSGQSFTRNPYRWWKGGYAEFGFLFKTRLKKEDNFFRAVYGLSFQLHSLSPDANRYFVDDYNGHTALAVAPYNFKWNRLVVSNLVAPFFLEFGPSDKVVRPDRIRYTNSNHFKMGIGGFAGFNIRTMQWLKWKEDGNTRQTKMIEDFNTNNLVYGVASYVGVGPVSLYAKYDLNPLFKNAEQREHLFSLALRVEF